MNRLFFDLETAPNIVLSWRVGRQITINPDSILKERSIICIGYKWEHQKKTQALVWDAKQNDKAMLERFVEIANTADELVAHNGDKFDLPWVRTRCIFHGVPMFPSYKIIDTLQWARRRFCFNSNKLDYLGKFLGVGGKTHTEYDLWKRILLENDRTALKAMVDYCKRDVEMLQQVYDKLAAQSPHHTHVGAMMGLDNWTSPFNGSIKVKRSITKVSAHGVRKHGMVCLTSGRYYTISDKAYKEYVEWRKLKRDNKASSSVPASTSKAGRECQVPRR
jgi:hypothetical protein